MKAKIGWDCVARRTQATICFGKSREEDFFLVRARGGLSKVPRLLGGFCLARFYGFFCRAVIKVYVTEGCTASHTRGRIGCQWPPFGSKGREEDARAAACS